jgi:molybdate transport system permease protein
VVVPLAAVAVAYVALPFAALLQRAPWSTLVDEIRQPVVTDALRLSVTTALAATALSLVVGIPLAWVLARTSLPGRSSVRALVTPADGPAAGGGGRGAAVRVRPPGPAGRTGLRHDRPAAPLLGVGVVAANTFVAMPFLVLTVESGLRAADTRYEDAAATLGASRWMIFRRVTLPNAAPSIITGALLCWARALGEFGATVTFAGNLQGRTQTMPLAVFLALESDRDAAIALSLVLIAVSLAVLVPLRDRWLAG